MKLETRLSCVQTWISFESLPHCHLIYGHIPQTMSLILVMFTSVIARRDFSTCLISRHTLTQLQKKGTQFREENNAKVTGDGEKCGHQNVFSKTGVHERCFWYVLSLFHTDCACEVNTRTRVLNSGFKRLCITSAMLTPSQGRSDILLWCSKTQKQG